MGSVTSCVSSALYFGEKLSVWFVCTVLICCIVGTILIVLGLGIGLGYNYCLVDMMTKHRYVPAYYKHPAHVAESIDEGQALAAPATEAPAMEAPAAGRSGNTSVVEEIFERKRDNLDDKSVAEPFDGSFHYNHEGDTSEEERFGDPYIHPRGRLNGTWTIPTISPPTDGPAILNTNATKPSDESYDNDDIEVKPVSNQLLKTTAVVPINGLDLIDLLAKLKADNKNYTLNIVTT